MHGMKEMEKWITMIRNEIVSEIRKYSSCCDISVFAMNKKTVLFSFNEDHVQDAACTLKVFIMLEYYRQKNVGIIDGNELIEITEDNAATGAGTIKFLSYGMKVKVSVLVELMVAISDHMAANLLIDYLGIDNINRTIQSYGFEKTILLKKYIVPKNKHVAEISAYEYARFYKMLDNNELINPQCCSEMKAILFSQKYKDFLAEPLLKYKHYVDMASKSGKVDGRTTDIITNSCVNDGGICITKNNDYYIAFLAEIHAKSEVKMSEMKELMHKVSKFVFEENGKNEIDFC